MSFKVNTVGRKTFKIGLKLTSAVNIQNEESATDSETLKVYCESGETLQAHRGYGWMDRALSNLV